jgi:hypothetical protein
VSDNSADWAGAPTHLWLSVTRRLSVATIVAGGTHTVAPTMLIVFAGLPASGKSTIARSLPRELGAVWLRIDSIEQAIRESGVVA